MRRHCARSTRPRRSTASCRPSTSASARDGARWPREAFSDDRGVETRFAGIAIPYVAAVLLICAGLVVGGSLGMAIAYGSLLLLVVAVFVGILAFIKTDDDAG